MNKKDLKRLSKSQLVKLLLKKEAKKPSNSVNEHEEIIKPIPPLRTGKLESIKPKPVPRKSVNEDIILPPPKQFRDRPPKPTIKPPQPPTPKDDFNFEDVILKTESQNLDKFKIISVQSRENKKFKSYTNELKVKIL